MLFGWWCLVVEKQSIDLIIFKTKLDYIDKHHYFFCYFFRLFLFCCRLWIRSHSVYIASKNPSDNIEYSMSTIIHHLQHIDWHICWAIIREYVNESRRKILGKRKQGLNNNKIPSLFLFKAKMINYHTFRLFA